MTVTNESKTTATGAVVSDALPAGTVNLSSIAGNATANISLVVTMTAANGATLNDTAKVTATTQDLNQNNNSATKSTRVTK